MAADPPDTSGVLTTTAGANQPTRGGPYIDSGRTTRNASNDSPPTPPALVGDVARGGGSRSAYANDVAAEIDNDATNPDADPPPQSPDSWQPGRDPYKNSGTDPYLRNPG